MTCFIAWAAPPGPQNWLDAKRATAFDPAVVDAFLRLTGTDDFWTDLELDSVWSLVQAMEQPSEYRYLPRDRLEEIALAFADFADLKLPDALGHSRRVADLAEPFARRMALAAQSRGLARSSSDGMRVRVAVNAANADRNAVYFGRGRGATIYITPPTFACLSIPRSSAPTSAKRCTSLMGCATMRPTHTSTSTTQIQRSAHTLQPPPR